MIPNIPGSANGWVAGEVSGSSSANGVTNLADIRAAVFFPFNKSAGNYRCPGDVRPAIIGTLSVGPRVRSYLLSCMMGNSGGTGTTLHPDYTENKKVSDIKIPNTSDALFFIDQASDPNPAKCSIDDGYHAQHEDATGTTPKIL